MNSVRTLLLLALAALSLAAVGGCSSVKSANLLTVPAGRYADAFDATREALRDLRFDLERVDARLGVITSRPKPTDGLATPWDIEQSSTSQEIEDLVHQQRRQVRVAFLTPRPRPDGSPADGPPELIPLQDAPMPANLVDYRGSVTIRVQVNMIRVERAGWRPSTSSVRGSTFTTDPLLEAAGGAAVYETPAGEDRELASRIIDRVRTRLELPRTRATSTVRRTTPQPGAAATPTSPAGPSRDQTPPVMP